MNNYKLYIRFRGHIVHKYEYAVNELEAICQALRYFKDSNLVSIVKLN